MKMFKYFLLILLFSGAAVANANADRDFDKGNWKRAQNLSRVLDSIYDASFDFPEMYVIRHNLELEHLKQVECDQVSADVLVRHFDLVFDYFQEFFPDEELPYRDAKKELVKLLGNDDFKRCQYEVESSFGVVEMIVYQSLERSIWVSIEHEIVD